MTGLMEMLRASAEGGDDERPKLAMDMEAVRLRDALSAYTASNVFAPGMIVRQKRQARGYKVFGDNDIGIVVEVLAEPIIEDSASSGTPYFRAVLDLRVGSIETDEDCFAVLHADSRYFEPVPLDEIKDPTDDRG